MSRTESTTSTFPHFCTRSFRRLFKGMTAAVFGLCIAVAPLSAGTSNSLMDLSTDGKLLACSNRDSGSVTIVDLATLKVTHEIPVGHHPEGVTFVGDSHRVAVAVYDDDIVRLLDADAGKEVARREVFDEPYGVVASPDGKRLFVTLDYPGQLLALDATSLEIQETWDVGKFVRGLAIDAKTESLFVTEYYTGILKQVSISDGKVVAEWVGGSPDNLARQVSLHPERPKAYIPHQRSEVTNPHGTGAIFPYISIVDLDKPSPETPGRRKRKQMDALRGTYVVANPWELALSPDGTRLYVLFSGTNEMYVCRVLDDNYRELSYEALVSLGSNPRAIKVSGDGSRYYVYNALDFEVVAYDAQTNQPVGAVKVCESPLSDEMLEGKKLFYLAKQPMVGLRWISCSSCHPDGQPDGRTWQQPEGLRNTQSLAGMAWTHPIHWSADRDEVQDFEHTIRSPLMAGRGLIRGPVSPSLGPPNGGRSAALDAMALYSNSHTVPLSPHAKEGLSESALRGQELFLSKEVGCSKCHSGPFFTDSQPGLPETFRMHDVGTGKDDPSEKIGPTFDTPSLLGIYRTAPYLHHGKATTLEEVLTTLNPQDQHGRTQHLSPEQVKDLVSFLKSLPYEDPVLKARQAGLKQVQK
ncbi:MAG: c-type cytochrome [Planctomycetaceae bacterium]